MKFQKKQKHSIVTKSRPVVACGPDWEGLATEGTREQVRVMEMFKKVLNSFPRWFCHFTLLPGMYVFQLPLVLSGFGIVIVLN